MRLTPAEVHNVAFKKPSIGKRGYDEDEVDAFLDLVEDELARLIEENNELTARLAGNGPVSAPAEVSTPVTPAVEPVTEAVETPAPVAAAPAPIVTGDAHVHAARLLGLAQETADRLTAEAKEEADRVRSEANAESERLRTEAKNYSDELLTEAHAKADATETEAQGKADAVLTGLTGQKTDLEKEIDDLRTYEREYRSRLKSWITDQLNQLDGHASESSVDA